MAPVRAAEPAAELGPKDDVTELGAIAGKGAPRESEVAELCIERSASAARAFQARL